MAEAKCVLGLQSKYKSIKNRRPGVCYSSRLAAIGEFDETGGTLVLADGGSIRLYIPPGALTKPQLIWLIVRYDEDADACQTATLSPVVDCGPDGTRFEVLWQTS